jgi:hypothetical protein
MVQNLHKMLFLSITIIILNLILSDQVIGQTITGFSPGSITAGTESILTINGSGFGTNGPDSTNYVEFTGASATEGVPIAKALEYVSWADNQIVVKVPSDAGTGIVTVINGGTTITSAISLNITYDIEDAVYNNMAYPLILVNTNTYGGYTFQFSPNFNSNTGATQAFTRALKTWKCGTNVNWIIGNPTTISVVAADGVNVITFDDASDQLDAGVLGQGVYHYESVNVAAGRWEIVDVDIIFANPNEANWNFGPGSPSFYQPDFESAALHELGHEHGLGHVNDNTDVMYPVIATGFTKRILNNNDINASNYIMAKSTASATQFAFPPMIAIATATCNTPAPIISSFAPSNGGLGTTVKIIGTSFTGALSVSFGGTPASSYSVISDTVITAVVATGTSGNINIVAPQGFATISGFTFIPTPSILAGGPTAFVTGGSVILTASTGTGYTYTWAKDGIDISGYNASTYTASLSGSYTVSIVFGLIKITSAAIIINAEFTLPPNNFELTITSATCQGSSDGSVNITAAQSLSYTATITGNGLNTPYPFTTSQAINNLAAGSYSVCISVAGQSGYQQCYDVVITQPADLSVYATVANNSNSVNLALSGGTQYNITLNGMLYTTSDNAINLPLRAGDNDLVVATDKLCQGTVEKHINISGQITPYPVPFQNTLNINLGVENINNVTVEIHNVSDGRMVFSKQLVNQSGVLQLDVTNLDDGIYALHVTMDNLEKIFKIQKK